MSEQRALQGAGQVDRPIVAAHLQRPEDRKTQPRPVEPPQILRHGLIAPIRATRWH